MQISINIINNLPESLLNFLGSCWGMVFMIALLILVIAGVIIATQLWVDVKNAKSKIKEMERKKNEQ